MSHSLCRVLGPPPGCRDRGHSPPLSFSLCLGVLVSDSLLPVQTGVPWPLPSLSLLALRAGPRLVLGSCRAGPGSGGRGVTTSLALLEAQGSADLQPSVRPAGMGGEEGGLSVPSEGAGGLEKEGLRNWESRGWGRCSAAWSGSAGALVGPPLRLSLWLPVVSKRLGI